MDGSPLSPSLSIRPRLAGQCDLVRRLRRLSVRPFFRSVRPAALFRIVHLPETHAPMDWQLLLRRRKTHEEHFNPSPLLCSEPRMFGPQRFYSHEINLIKSRMTLQTSTFTNTRGSTVRKLQGSKMAYFNNKYISI